MGFVFYKEHNRHAISHTILGKLNSTYLGSFPPLMSAYFRVYYDTW